MSIFVDQEIQGARYRLMRLPPRDAGRIALQVGQVLAAALANGEAVRGLVGLLGQAKGEDDGKLLDLLKSDEALLSALAGQVAKLDAARLYDLGLECISNGRLFTQDGKLAQPEDVDAHFTEHPQRLFLVLAWALRVNAAGFFGKGATVSK